jgi:hypothetical protein
MHIETIDEPIRVLAAFAGGRCDPLRFRWGRRAYRVDRVNARWIDRQGDTYALHYSVQSGEETYYLHFAAGEVQWRLDKVVTA